jgi:predicted AAA+ superfamily ATPase
MLKQNPWWEGKEVEGIKDYKERFLIKEVAKYIHTPQIIAILGMRRTGKSVLLFQIIRRLLARTPPKRIFYFSFDEILGKEPNILEEAINIYEEQILKDDINNVHIFFDEINHIENWQVVLKRFYDLRRNIKFFVSGSSSIYLKKTKESLAGRIYEFHLAPLGFQEYLYLKNINIEDEVIQAPMLKRELSKYFVSGTLPEIISESDFLKTKRYINSIIDKVVFFDIPKVYDVNEPEILKMILSFVAQRPGMILEYQSLANSLKVTYQTISKYVDYLEKAYLIRLVYNFRGSPIARARKLKKAYLGSVNLVSGFLDSETELLEKLSLLAENIVCLFLDAQWFWKKYTELDFYHKNIAIEVKYTEGMPDIKNYILAARYLKSKKVLVVTKDIEQIEKRGDIKVSYQPLWKFLLKPSF